MDFTQSSDILNLLSMTPFAFKASKEVIEELKNKKSFSCQADFLIRLYKNSN
jgi:23S rRNA (guanine745-N1)-methyltransferase